MELFGIIFSLPVAFVTSAGYFILVNRFIKPKTVAARVVVPMSAVVLVLWLTELISVIGFGTVSVATSIGRDFYLIHAALFILVVPSLANLLILQRAIPFVVRWFIVAPICTVFALVAVLLQYQVSETLFGMDGTHGLYW